MHSTAVVFHVPFWSVSSSIRSLKIQILPSWSSRIRMRSVCVGLCCSSRLAWVPRLAFGCLFGCGASWVCHHLVIWAVSSVSLLCLLIRSSRFCLSHSAWVASSSAFFCSFSLSRNCHVSFSCSFCSFQIVATASSSSISGSFSLRSNWLVSLSCSSLLFQNSSRTRCWLSLVTS